jgi:putative membrane protein
MKYAAVVALATCLISSAALAQSLGEKTGINPALGIAPTTADFVKQAAISDMT